MDNNPTFISIESKVIDLFSDNFTQAEIIILIESIEDILENITDVFDGMDFGEIIESQKIDLQNMFSQLEKIIPHYVPLLRASFNEFGDEAYLEEDQVKSELKLENMNLNGYFPKLILDDGSIVFALMQVAAWKAGIGDENLRLWYKTTTMFLLNVAEEQKVAH